MGRVAPRTPKRKPTPTLVADPPIVVPDAPAPDGPAVLPVIVPAEKTTTSARSPGVRPAGARTTEIPVTERIGEPPSTFDAPTEAVPTVPAVTTAPIVLPAILDDADLVVASIDEAATDEATVVPPEVTNRSVAKFRRARPRVRRVTRVVRHVDTWSVFKVALVFNVFFYVTTLVAGVLLWQVAYATGTVDNIENFFLGFGWETFELKGGEIYHNAWVAGLFVSIGLTGLAVFVATLFNLITDLVGGIRVSVLEEEVVVRNERRLLSRTTPG